MMIKTFEIENIVLNKVFFFLLFWSNFLIIFVCYNPNLVENFGVFLNIFLCL